MALAIGGLRTTEEKLKKEDGNHEKEEAKILVQVLVW